MMLEQPEGRAECSNTMARLRKGNACQFRLGACFEFNDLGRVDPALFHEFGNGQLGFCLQLHLFELQLCLSQFELLCLDLGFRVREWGGLDPGQGRACRCPRHPERAATRVPPPPGCNPG